MNRSQRGFTLVELLVVMAIIGILSSVVLASLTSARKKGYDARRIADVKQLQLALELYYDANNSYPATGSLSALQTGGFISTIPTDPRDNTAYGYVQTSSGASYVLGTMLETTNAVLNTDSDVNQAVTLNGAASNCNTAAGDPGAGELVYCVTP